MATRISFCAAVIGIGFHWFVSTGLSDETIADADLPASVTMAITQKYPKADLTSVKKTTKNNADLYEVNLKNVDKRIEVALFEDGKFDWVAVDMPVKNLPKPVVGAVRKKYPAVKYNRAATVYTVENGKDKLAHYSVEITTRNEKTRVLAVSLKGEVKEDTEI